MNLREPVFEDVDHIHLPRDFIGWVVLCFKYRSQCRTDSYQNILNMAVFEVGTSLNKHPVEHGLVKDYHPVTYVDKRSG